MRAGVPANKDQRGWIVGFYPASDRGLRSSGTAKRSMRPAPPSTWPGSGCSPSSQKPISQTTSGTAPSMHGSARCAMRASNCRRRWRLVGQRTSAVQRSVSRMSRATSHASRALPAGFEKTVAHAYLGCMAYAFAVSPCRGLASEIFGLQRLVGHPNGLNWTTKCSRRQADHAAKSALIERAVGPPKHAHRRVAAALSNDSVRGARRSTSASRAYPAECGACVLNRWRTQTREDKP